MKKSSQDQLLLIIQQVNLGFKTFSSSDMGVGLLVFVLISLMQGVSCQTWGLKLPERLEGITGSCITIPCSFTLPGNHEADILNCSNGLVWIKGSLYGLRVLTGSKPFLNKIQGYVSGNVTQKNCDTVFQIVPKNYSDVYFLRLECPSTLRYTFSEGVIISTQPVPPPPQMSPVVQVSEGQLVTLQCSAPQFCSALPPSFTWLPTDSARQEMKQLRKESDGRAVMTSIVTFVASALHHNQSISCRVSYPLSTGGSTESSATTQRLNVQYAPRSTAATLSPSGPVSEGSTVSLSCSSDANPPVSLYTWYRFHGEQLNKTAEGQILILQVTLNNTGAYVCEAQTGLGSQRSSPVFLELSTSGGYVALVVPYVLIGLLFILLILIVAGGVKKYQSLSKRLKAFELQGEHTYTTLRNRSITANYDQIQQPQTKTSSDLSDYENLQEMKISKTNSGLSGSKGLS